MTDRANIEVVDSSLVSRTTRESLAGATLVERTLGGRVFTMAGGETMQTAPHVNMEHGGMVLSGPTALQTAWRRRARTQDDSGIAEPQNGHGTRSLVRLASTSCSILAVSAP